MPVPGGADVVRRAGIKERLGRLLPASATRLDVRMQLAEPTLTRRPFDGGLDFHGDAREGQARTR